MKPAAAPQRMYSFAGDRVRLFEVLVGASGFSSVGTFVATMEIRAQDSYCY